MLKKMLIKLFRLHEINKLLIKSKNQQKEISDRYWKEVLKDTEDLLNRNHLLELAEKDACIVMLEEQIKLLKQRERDVDNQNFKAKKQIKENFAISQKITMEVGNFCQAVNGIWGRMNGITDELADHKKQIEKGV